MKKLVQACACLALAITASYLIWEKTNAAFPQTAPTKPITTAVITPARPAAKLAPRAPQNEMLGIQVELGG